MNKEYIRKIIVEQFNDILRDELKKEEYKGQKLIIHHSEFNGKDSWIAFNLEDEDSLIGERAERFLEFDESDFSSWIQENEDVSKYMEKDFDYSPEEGSSAPYETFDYETWKGNNDPDDYAYSFLVDMITDKGMPKTS